MPERIGSDVIQKRLTEFGFPVVKDKLKLLKSKEKLAKELSKKNVSNTWYTGNRIRLIFDGETLSNTIKVVPHEEWVGSWSRTRPVIFIDNDVPEKFRKSIAIHETLEKYLKERYGLDENAEGHEAAEEIERKWFLKHYSEKEWDNYMKIVERIHRKEMLQVKK